MNNEQRIQLEVVSGSMLFLMNKELTVQVSDTTMPNTITNARSQKFFFRLSTNICQPSFVNLKLITYNLQLNYFRFFVQQSHQLCHVIGTNHFYACFWRRQFVTNNVGERISRNGINNF